MGVMERRKRRAFTKEFKAETVRLVVEGRRSGSPEHAHGVIRPLFRWYNHEHRHGALAT